MLESTMQLMPMNHHGLGGGQLIMRVVDHVLTTPLAQTDAA
jgi:hypothetical protein